MAHGRGRKSYAFGRHKEGWALDSRLRGGPRTGNDGGLA